MKLPPLHLAAAEGDLEAVKTLIAAGAEIDLQDHLGRTALYHAVCGSRALVIQLLAAGANGKIKDHDGRTTTGEMRGAFFKDELDSILLEPRELASQRLAQRVASALDGATAPPERPPAAL
ncbi:ankyrin repeat domain-containing protein [Ramlibacter sp. 2FC]|uniref:ankyrin repeat domain-containing protein n=1 Tax=Ramlibacter sp. 2FC TaxID=2502188 RepID=UPI0010F861D8|nr:ankyrin repeat domain-containing protein [Ramlibacter sp. 2FC]